MLMPSHRSISGAPEIPKRYPPITVVAMKEDEKEGPTLSSRSHTLTTHKLYIYELVPMITYPFTRE